MVYMFFLDFLFVYTLASVAFANTPSKTLFKAESVHGSISGGSDFLLCLLNSFWGVSAYSEYAELLQGRI